MRFFLYLIIILWSSLASAQTNKPIIDTGVLGKWPSFGPTRISPQGNYVGFLINNQPVSSQTFVIRSTKNNWRRGYPGINTCYFSGDDRQAIFQRSDSLFFIQLGTGQPEKVVQIHSFQRPQTESCKWLAYQQKSSELILLNLLNGKERIFNNVKRYGFNQQGTAFIMIADMEKIPIIQYLDLKSEKLQTIWKGQDGEQPTDFKFDTQGKNLVFTAIQKRDNRDLRSFWYYNPKTEKAVLRIKDGDKRIESGWLLTGSAEFSGNGRWLFFKMSRLVQNTLSPAITSAKVDIWHYKDIVLQSDQLARVGTNQASDILMAMPVNGITTVKILDENENLLTNSRDVTGDFVVVAKCTKRVTGNWMKNEYSASLVSLKDGSQRLIRKSVGFGPSPSSFSPNGRFLVYWLNAVGEEAGYYSHDIATGITRKVDSLIPVHLGNDLQYIEGLYHSPVGEDKAIIGWYEQGSYFLVYDNYDIWKIDASGATKPLNITGGYGKQYMIKLRFADNNIFFHGNLTGNEELILTGFNQSTKYNGFFKLKLATQKEPELLTMGPYIYEVVGSQNFTMFGSDNMGSSPIKAASSNSWLVQRQSAVEAPNLFITKDYKNFKAITNFNPQKNYNWMTSELLNFQLPDGRWNQGILYKPENFDPSKKYPVIFNYYEKKSQEMYQFKMPEPISDNINIPWFVSQGYLVCLVDIQFSIAARTGLTNEANYQLCVEAAAQYLMQRPYINSKVLGIQGHSFGGANTQSLALNSHLFAAASSMAGQSDRITSYFLIDDADIHPQARMGVSLWERPDLYITKQAIYKADKMTTPILIVHNKLDSHDWRYSLELYMALRRLNKPCWMLQYEGEGHSLENPANEMDYTMRLTQFFNHYLRGYPATVWMTDGVPAKLKGIKNGYEPDTSGKQP